MILPIIYVIFITVLNLLSVFSDVLKFNSATQSGIYYFVIAIIFLFIITIIILGIRDVKTNEKKITLEYQQEI